MIQLPTVMTITHLVKLIRQKTTRKWLTLAPKWISSMDHSYHLQPRKARVYGHLHVTIDDVCMNQYSLKKGLELFGTEGSLAVETSKI
jgi:hypothetical protein